MKEIREVLSEEDFKKFMKDLDEQWENPGWEEVLRKVALKHRIDPDTIENVIKEVQARYSLALSQKVMKA